MESNACTLSTYSISNSILESLQFTNLLSNAVQTGRKRIESKSGTIIVSVVSDFSTAVGGNRFICPDVYLDMSRRVAAFESAVPDRMLQSRTICCSLL